MDETSPNAEHIKSVLSSAISNIDELLNWNDDIPTEILDGTAVDKKFKVRKNWFQGIVGLTGFCKMVGIFQEEDLEEINKFEIEYSSKSFNQSLTTAEDIERGNQILELLRKSIQSYLS